MARSQPTVAAPIIALSAYQNRRIHNIASCLTSRDRLDVNDLRESASLAGFDRLVVHDREDDDASEVGNFLSAYRRGEAWSRWSFARRGAKIRAWCSLTWADKGEYDTLGQAFEAVLGVAGASERRGGATVLESEDRPSAVITDLMPRLRACGANRLGSAA